MNRTLTTSERTISFASNWIGLIKSPNDNPMIMQMYYDIGQEWVENDDWSSAFANWICLKLGLVRSGNLNAQSWLNVGQITSFPHHGDIVVFWKENKNSWKGHVGFFAGFTGTKEADIYCLGGNQQNEVNISVFPNERLLGFRRLI